jgi:menaquinol-cytochrome c reductase iron-sulfur subunit
MEPSRDQTSSLTAGSIRRRTLFQWLSYGLGAIATVILAIPFVGYILGMRKRPVKWVPLGSTEDFPPDETRLVTFNNPIRQSWDGTSAHIGVYVCRQGGKSHEGDQFLVLAANCAHLGCPVSWFPQSGLFMCPCHGGVYYATGERASGPPPRGLFRCVWRVRGGELEIQAPHYPTLQDTLEESA